MRPSLRLLSPLLLIAFSIAQANEGEKSLFSRTLLQKVDDFPLIDHSDERLEKIINGEPASNSTYPWFVLPFVSTEEGTFLAGCGGSLVAPEYVLSAAHCVPNFQRGTLGVIIGALCPFKSDNCGQQYEIVYVDEVITHPNYNPTITEDGSGYDLEYDFVLLKLSMPAQTKPVTM